MTIRILATLAIAATMFTACGDSTTTNTPSKAEQCSGGLTNDCLLGTWSIDGPTIPQSFGNDVIYIIHESHNFKTNPAKLRFYVDEKKNNKFEFANSPLSKINCSSKTYGNWAVLGNSIQLYANIGDECMERSTATITPIIKNNGGSITMTFPEIFFMEPEMKNEDGVDKRNTTEVYTFVSAN